MLSKAFNVILKYSGSGMPYVAPKFDVTTFKLVPLSRYVVEDLPIIVIIYLMRDKPGDLGVFSSPF